MDTPTCERHHSPMLLKGHQWICPVDWLTDHLGAGAICDLVPEGVNLGLVFDNGFFLDTTGMNFYHPTWELEVRPDLQTLLTYLAGYRCAAVEIRTETQEGFVTFTHPSPRNPLIFAWFSLVGLQSAIEEEYLRENCPD